MTILRFLGAAAVIMALAGCRAEYGSKPGMLGFPEPPGSAKAFDLLPPVQVELPGRGTSPVTLFLEANPPGATLSGTLTVDAIDGVATFDDLSIDIASNQYQFAAFAGEMTPAVSDVFVVTPPTGALVAVAGSPFDVGDGPVALAVDRSGTFLYVTCQLSAPSGVFAYAIASDGSLSAIGGSPYTQGQATPSAVVVDSSRQFLFVGNEGSGAISAWGIGSSGALSALGNTASSLGPVPLVADPVGKHLFAGRGNTTQIESFSYDAGGVLAPAPGSPFNAGIGNVLALAIDPSGQFLHVAGGSGVASFGIATNGQLSPVGGPIVTATGRALAIDHGGRFLFSANSTSFTVSGFAIAIDGSLSAITGSPFLQGSVARLGLAAHPDADFLYMVSANNRVSTLVLDSSGVPTLLAPAELTAGPNTAVAIDREGKHLFVASEGPSGGQVFVYGIVP